MKIKRQKHSVKIKIRLFCSKEQSPRSSWGRIRATGTARDSGSSKKTIQWPISEKLAMVAWQKGDQMKQDATTGTAEDSGSCDRMNYAEWECLEEKHTLKKCCLKQHKTDRVCEAQLFQIFNWLFLFSFFLAFFFAFFVYQSESLCFSENLK